MSDPYERVKGGRLSFKGGELAASSKAISKKKKKKTKLKDVDVKVQPFSSEGGVEDEVAGDGGAAGEGAGAGEVYTIDAAKRMKYDDLFPVEAKKFGYDPKAKQKSVEEALDDRVKKKADRYCK